MKEKLLAAHRAGIKKVLIPADNRKDFVEIPEVIRKSIDIISVKTVDEVLKHALTKKNLSLLNGPKSIKFQTKTKKNQKLQVRINFKFHNIIKPTH